MPSSAPKTTTKKVAPRISVFPSLPGLGMRPNRIRVRATVEKNKSITQVVRVYNRVRGVFNRWAELAASGAPGTEDLRRLMDIPEGATEDEIKRRKTRLQGTVIPAMMAVFEAELVSLIAHSDSARAHRTHKGISLVDLEAVRSVVPLVRARIPVGKEGAVADVNEDAESSKIAAEYRARAFKLAHPKGLKPKSKKKAAPKKKKASAEKEKEPVAPVAAPPESSGAMLSF